MNLVLRAVIAAALLVGSPALADFVAPRPDSELSVGAGVLGTGDLYAAQAVEGRWLRDGFTVEGGVLSTVPALSASGAWAGVVSARLGWTGERLSITGGAWAQLAPLAQPSLQYAPTLRAAWRFDRFAVSAGVFDLHALAIARLSVETEDFGLGYVAPLGAEAHATLRLGRGFGVRVQGLAFRVGDAQVGFLMLSGVFEAGRARGDA